MNDTEAFLKGKFLAADLSLEIFHLRSFLLKDNFIEFITDRDSLHLLTLQISVANNNIGFITLWKKQHYKPALAFIRILSDHLVCLYAEYLHPEKVLSKIYSKNKELNQILIKGEKIKPSDIRKKMKEDYLDFERIWELYHKFIHPSYLQSLGGSYNLIISQAGLTDIIGMIKLDF